MSFEIVIIERRNVVKVVGKEWGVIGTKEVARDTQFLQDREEPRTRIEEIRGYTPEIEKTVVETREVLKQCVDELDLSAVIKAINKL